MIDLQRKPALRVQQDLQGQQWLIPSSFLPPTFLKAAIRLVEDGDANGLSLRAVAAALGVKAPSLYRYFPHKEALELAVAEEVLNAMSAELKTPSEHPDPDTRFREVVNAYLRFARERFSLYVLIVQNRLPGTYGSKAGKPSGCCCWTRQAASPESLTTPLRQSRPGPSFTAMPLSSIPVRSEHPALGVDSSAASKSS